jgi:hypothetical protein
VGPRALSLTAQALLERTPEIIDTDGPPRPSAMSPGQRAFPLTAQALLERAPEIIDGPPRPSAMSPGLGSIDGVMSLSQQLAQACDAVGLSPALDGWQRGEAHLALSGTVLVLARLVEGYIDNHRRGTQRVLHGVVDVEGLPPEDLRPVLEAWLALAGSLGERPRSRCRYCGAARDDLALGACPACAQLFDGTVY